MKNKLTPKSCGHKTVPPDHFHSYKIILESVDTILYPHTNLYPTLFNIYIFNIYIYTGGTETSFNAQLFDGANHQYTIAGCRHRCCCILPTKTDPPH